MFAAVVSVDLGEEMQEVGLGLRLGNLRRENQLVLGDNHRAEVLLLLYLGLDRVHKVI